MKELWRKIRHWFYDLINGGGGDPAPSPDPQPGPAPDPEPAPAPSGDDDAIDFAALDWCWGGFKGGGAALADHPRIASLSVSSSRLSYKWARGGCEDLGAASASDASCIAAFFCRLGGRWRGGKIDWISTSRTSRTFENIEGHYNGWDISAVRDAEAYAFVIVSKDGKRRTNVISCTR